MLSPAILRQGHTVGRGDPLKGAPRRIDLEPLLELVAVHADIVDAPDLREPVVTVPDYEFPAAPRPEGLSLLTGSGPFGGPVA